jgi:hypothetical protein
VSTWREEKRKDRASEAEQARLDAITAAEVETIRAAAFAESQRAADEQQRQHEREAEQAKAAADGLRREQRREALAALRTWAAGHVVDLLIYPLALVSAVMAVPAMAAYGAQQYGNATGYALPVISELGMWAFALAVMVSRRANSERPVFLLQAGVYVFGAVALGLNVLHGLDRGLDAAVVMGVASVAGVVAHQLVTASPRRTCDERDAARIARLTRRKVIRVRRAAVRAAVAEIDAQGGARLVFEPGRFVLAGRTRLERAIVPGLPVTTAMDDDLEGLDRELADLLTAEECGVTGCYRRRSERG